MAVRDGRGDVKQTTTGFRGPLMVQSLTSAKSKFLSLNRHNRRNARTAPRSRTSSNTGGSGSSFSIYIQPPGGSVCRH